MKNRQIRHIEAQNLRTITISSVFGFFLSAKHNPHPTTKPSKTFWKVIENIITKTLDFLYILTGIKCLKKSVTVNLLDSLEICPSHIGQVNKWLHPSIIWKCYSSSFFTQPNSSLVRGQVASLKCCKKLFSISYFVPICSPSYDYSLPNLVNYTISLR